MQSLRTRRPSDSRQPIKRSISKLAKSPSTRQNARKSTVDDKIKKRMSLKYAEISSPTDVSVPTVPSIPIGLRPGLARDPDEIVRDVAEVKEDPRLADQRLLDKQNFDPDAYLKAKLANSTEAELKSLQSSLRSAKDDTAIELQKNVFKNYAEFVLISKEISTLENEMLELKEGLQEWKSMPSLLHIEESASVADRRRAARSSVADLRILYASQMQTLHSQISGSAKFAPATPGRHVISEMDGVYELNAATYKVVNIVRFVILDDAVLVARRRGGGAVAASGIGGGETAGKLVAERCWPLNEMLVLDTKDTANMINETHVYRTEASSDKKALLGQFRQVAEELAVRKRKEREGEHERRKSLWAMGDRGSAAFNPEKLPPLPDWMAEACESRLMRRLPRTFPPKIRATTTARVLSELSDDLTALLDALARPRNTKSTCVELVGHLLRLGARSRARETFLAARSEAIRRYIRAIPFEGHIGLYVHDLAVVVFTALKHTADWFLAGFVEHEMTSSFIDWARGQIEVFAELFRKQVYNSDADQQTIDEALRVAHTQSRKLLQEFGLDFRYLLDDLLVKTPKAPLTLAPPALPAHIVIPPSVCRNRTSQLPSSAMASSATGTSNPSVPSRARTAAENNETEPTVTPLLPREVATARRTPLPPRSTNRPGSGARPPPVMVPPREGMF
ncbi:hypothetical protein EV401DRAFT_1912524 [Pisolithus croceorrhizus]|nr:hypothetical protein EV401DRAFT_1912524 [Pisolithus croceorrhizus]